MDQHPIPQDVTGFQFKLIGTMTVKQFGYVATGVVLAVVMYYLPLKGFFGILAKVVLIPLFGGSGALIAFVPIEGRPIDVMATNFFKAIFSPNQYVYRKTGRKFSFSMINTNNVTAAAAAEEEAKKKTPASVKQKEVSAKEAQLHAFLESTHSENQSALDKKEQAMLTSLALPKAPAPSLAARPSLHTTAAGVHPATPTAKPAVAAHPAPIAAPKPALHAAPVAAPVVHTPAPTPAPKPVLPPTQQQEATLAQQETQLQQQLQTAKQEETTTHAPAAHQKVTTLENQLQVVHEQKMLLEKELQSLKNQLSAQQPTTASAHAAPGGAGLAGPVNPPAVPTQLSNAPAPVIPKADAPVIPASQYAKTIAQTAAPTKGDMPRISDTPNVVVGIVKDPRGNILPNMLVEVKDKDGNPVRAFKTNALGQFASATPLSPGLYTIELDDPKKLHSFDVIQITASNQIMLPIEIVSHDAREELRKELFN